MTAVTRHIKRIETDLGIKPFDRLHQGVRLTDAGRELSDAISPAFAATNRGLECARQRSGQGTLLIGSETAFGKHWLVPRLPILHVLYPSVSVDLRLQESQCTDIQTGPVDGGRSVFQHLLNTNAGVKTAGSAGNVEAP